MLQQISTTNKPTKTKQQQPHPICVHPKHPKTLVLWCYLICAPEIVLAGYITAAIILRKEGPHCEMPFGNCQPQTAINFITNMPLINL